MSAGARSLKNVRMRCLNSYNRLAEDKWYSRLTLAAKEYESEMGLLCITVVGYTAKDGRFTIDM